MEGVSGTPQAGPTGPGRLRLLGLVAVGAGAALLLGFNLAGMPLLDPDESKHAEIAREMLMTGRWLRPVLNFQPYDDKPSLLYVLVGLCYRWFGVGEATARLVPACAGWSTLVGVYWFAARRDVWTGLAAAGLLAACPFFVQIARFTNFDALITALMTGSVLAFVSWMESPGRRGLLFAAYVLVALGTLAKGPMAPALVLVPLGFAVLSGSVSARRVWLPGGALAAIGVVAAWSLPVLVIAPDYLRNFLWVHNIQRYLVPESLFHPEPVYFFLPILLGGLLPWSLMVPAALQAAWRRSPGDRVLVVYVVWVVVFFSLSTGKLATYVLPAFPALAVLTAVWLGERRRRASADLRAAVTVTAVLLAIMPPVAYLVLRLEEPSATGLSAVFAPASAVGVALLVAGRRRIPTTATALGILCAGMIATTVAFNLFGAGLVGRLSSDADLGSLARRVAAESTTIAYQVRPYSFLFYARLPVVEQLEDDGCRTALSGQGPLLLLTRERKLEKLRRVIPELRLRELGRNERHVLYRVE